MDGDRVVDTAVSQYSVLVGVVLIIVFVLPCIVFALVSKCFQKTTRRTQHSVRSLLTGTLRMDATNDETRYEFLDSSSSSFGVFGQIDFPVEKIECVEQMVCVKTPLACITTWKAYAPDILCTGSSDTKKLITVKKLASYNQQFTSSGSVDSKECSHIFCLKTEISLLSHIPPHPHLLNFLGVCMSGAVPSGILLEYPPYGSLHSFLVCKRRGRISNNTKPWGGLDSTHEEPSVLLGMSDSLSLPLLSDDEIRAQPFRLPLNERFCEMDEVLWGMQIASGMDFLISKDIYHKRLCSENVVISAGFFLKLTGVECDTPLVHRNTNVALLKRTPTGRNIRKWEAPEVGNTNIHSAESEVWRFGMLLWEVSSVGDTPFADIPHRKLAELLKLGETPHQPEECSERLYNIMQSCWSVKPEERPSFSALIQQFQEIAATSKDLPSLTTYHPTPTTSPSHKPISPSKEPKYRARRPHTCVQKSTSAVVLLIDSPSPDNDEVPGYHETDV